jgi:thiosulfate/3-mercaptopyruvate sulfurtransferase
MRLPGPLVDATWLEAALGDPGLVVADVRWYPDRRGRDGYEAGHIPGAVFIDEDADLAGKPGGEAGRHPLPDPQDFARAMERAGIGDDTAVVAYDDTSDSNAARLWWMLDVTGHPAAVLDGGLAAWSGDLEQGTGALPPPATFTPRPWPAEAMADADLVNRLRRDPSGLVLDARSSERYRGEVEPIDPIAGHIPGARNAPWTDNVDPDTGRFLPAESLRRRYEDLGVAPDRTTAVHCGSGVTACHLALAIRLAGLPDPRLYVGSWSGWIASGARPMAKGPEAG